MASVKVLTAFLCAALALPPLHAAPLNKKTAAAPASAAGVPAALRSLSMHDRIAQLIVVRAYGDYPRTTNPEYQRLIRLIAEEHVGGFIVANRVIDGSVVNAQPFEMAAYINRLQRLAKTPLFVASDFEHGASMRVAETAKFPYLMAFGAGRDIASARELGAATAREAHAIGVSWIFAPDADVNNNPDNPIINVRSYGEDPQKVAAGVAAYIEGAHADPANYVLVTAKHFPGHGDTAEDSHMQVAKLDQPKERIEALELTPFRAAIEHGVDAIMTAHMSVPAFEPDPIPATVSHKVLTGLLRNELGFKGLIVTDAMDMQGVTSLYSQGEAAVRAIEAGADVVLMPANPEASIRGLMAAVASGRISAQRINYSAAKVMAAKQKAGLFRSRLVNLDAISDRLDQPQFDLLAQRVADRAITLLKDDKHLFPVASPDSACLVVMSEGQFSQRGQRLLNEVHRRAPNMKAFVASSAMNGNILSAVGNETASCSQIFVAAFVTVAAYRGSVALEGGLNTFLTGLIHGPAPVALISLGNPYLFRYFPDVSAYAATFSTTTTSEFAAAKAIFGEIAIGGRMPVSIPGLAKVGDGMDVPVRSKPASNATK